MSVSIPITSLTKYWPAEKNLPSDKVDAASLEYTTGFYIEQFAAFPVFRTPSVPQTITDTNAFIFIPPAYRHPLRFLNFKNACYISALSIDRSDVDLETEDGRLWATIRDGMARNVVFNDAVRNAFFAEVRSTLLMKPNVPLDKLLFRSITLDTWLIEEYLFCAHDPPSCKKLKRNKPYKADPLRFGESQISCSTRNSSLLALFVISRLDEMGE
jgi:hypothetical protein